MRLTRLFTFITVSIFCIQAMAQETRVRDNWIPVIEARDVDNWPWKFIAYNSSPVGQIMLESGQSCTGVLVGDDMFLTASHCINPSNCSDASVYFLKQAGVLSKDYVGYDCSTILYSCGRAEAKYENCDHALVKLEGSPGVKHGYASLSPAREEGKGEVISFHHPHRIFKVASTGEKILSVDNFLVHNIPLEEGSSGAPIFDKSGQIIAIQSKGSSNLFNQPMASLVSQKDFPSDIIFSGSRSANYLGAIVWSGFNLEVRVYQDQYNSLFGKDTFQTYETGIRWVSPLSGDWLVTYFLGSIQSEGQDLNISATGISTYLGVLRKISQEYWFGAQLEFSAITHSGFIRLEDPFDFFDFRETSGVFALHLETCRAGLLNSGKFSFCGHLGFRPKEEDLAFPSPEDRSGNFVDPEGYRLGFSMGYQF